MMPSTGGNPHHWRRMDMDFDRYELMLEVEDALGFSIPVEDAAELSTMGKLYDYVLAHGFRGKQDACLTSMTFFGLPASV